MDEKRRKALEAKGYGVGDVEDFLGLAEWESRLVELRYALSVAIHERRLARDLTQAQAAEIVGSSQSRVAKMEVGEKSVSLDLMFRALFKLGGTLADCLEKATADKAAGGGQAGKPLDAEKGEAVPALEPGLKPLRARPKGEQPPKPQRRKSSRQPAE